jgi:cytochrome c556
MRRHIASILVVALMSSVAARAADKVQTVEELDTVMKRIGPAQQAVSKALQAMAYADAKKQLDVIEADLKDAQNFWVVKKREDATKFTKSTLVKIESLKKLVDTKPPDQTAVMTAYREVGVACAACHRVYRTTDDDNRFILKPGTVN